MNKWEEKMKLVEPTVHVKALFEAAELGCFQDRQRSGIDN